MRTEKDKDSLFLKDGGGGGGVTKSRSGGSGGGRRKTRSSSWDYYDDKDIEYRMLLRSLKSLRDIPQRDEMILSSTTLINSTNEFLSKSTGRFILFANLCLLPSSRFTTIYFTTFNNSQNVAYLTPRLSPQKIHFQLLLFQEIN